MAFHVRHDHTHTCSSCGVELPCPDPAQECPFTFTECAECAEEET